MKMLINFLAYVVMFMVIIAVFRYIMDGTLEGWVWMRSLVIALAISAYNVYRNKKRGAYDESNG